MSTKRLILLWLTLLTSITLWSYWIGGGTPLAELLANVVYIVAPLSAAAAGLELVRSFGVSGQGKGWLLFTMGLLGWAVGECLWVYYDTVVHINPYPSMADVFYIIGYPLMAIGLLQVMKAIEVRWSAVPPAVRFLCIVIGCGLLATTLYFGVYLAYEPSETWPTNLIAMSYGVGDSVLLWLTLVAFVVLWEFRGGKLSRPWIGILVGLSVTTIADIAFAIGHDAYELQISFWKSALDNLWIFGYLAFTWGLFTLADYINEAQERAQAQSK